MAEGSSPGLAQRSVGLKGDWIASVTNVAPTAATTLTMAALIGAAGLGSPLALLIAGAAMLCCAVAYHRLDAWQANACAPVHWVARGLSPIIGFGVGILVLMTALTSNIGNITLIGSTVLSLVAPSQMNDKPLTWVVATVICAAVVAIAVIGVKTTIRFQGWIVAGEYAIILVLAIWGLTRELTSHAAGITAPSWSWFTTSHSPGGSTGLIAGVVIATFLLGGWDSPIYLGDEQRHKKDPGRSVLLSITFCTLWVIFLFVCLQGLAPAKDITANSANVLPYLAGTLASGKAFADLVAIAEAGWRIVSLVRAGTRPSSLLTRAGFERALTVLAAVGGSTNAIIHLCAVAGRRGLALPLDEFARIAARTPVIADIAPNGGVVKTAAASRSLLRHSGPAVVFHSYDEMRRRVDDPDLDVTADSVLVLAGCGPAGAGMPEWGNIPVPAKLLRAGVTDMVRVTDGRMSGTGYGTVVLHVAPESAIGGPLSRLRDGDVVTLDAVAGTLSADVPAGVLAARDPVLPVIADRRGWPVLHRAHVLQAPEGCDYDFLRAASPDQLPFVEPVIGRS
jgi:amino acid transporter